MAVCSAVMRPVGLVGSTHCSPPLLVASLQANGSAGRTVAIKSLTLKLIVASWGHAPVGRRPVGGPREDKEWNDLSLAETGRDSHFRIRERRPPLRKSAARRRPRPSGVPYRGSGRRGS